ncbi:MAG: hypothetical protein HY303_00275, partial [Candidatus Wallbacteria bacterium]|nr:hypothetical protein [Candidatus Wallbacteria bacterium]
MTIPNKIHFIFGLRPDFGGKPFSYVHYLAVATALKVNRPDQLYLHFQFEPDTYWWKKACELATPRRLTAAVSVHGTPMDEHAHRTDLARLEILLSEGGIYLDLDVICVNPFTPL